MRSNARRYGMMDSGTTGTSTQILMSQKSADP
jgi:hypothetical protein